MPAPSSSSITIRAVTADDTPAIADIYNHYVMDTLVTFEEEPVSGEELWRRVEAVRTADLPWLVADDAGMVVGYAYATPWRARIGYRYSVEVTVYIDARQKGRGIGSRLYETLFTELQSRGFHSAIGGIALPNDASVALHEKFDMKKVAHFERVGIKFGHWTDVGYWQRIFDSEPPR